MTHQSLFITISHIAEASIVLGVLIGFLRLKKLGPCQKELLIVLVVALLAEVFTRLLVVYEMTTYPVFHFYAVIEYGLLALIFARAFEGTKLARMLKWSILVMMGYALLNVYLWQPLSEPNTNVVLVSGVVLITMSTVFLFRTLNRMVYRHIEKSALFWISISVLMYFASTILMFAFLTRLIPVDMEITGSVLVLNAVFNIVHYICFGIALWMKPE